MRFYPESQVHVFISTEMVPKDIQQELRQLYNALCELLRHFWACFPTTTKSLEEKVGNLMHQLDLGTKFSNVQSSVSHISQAQGGYSLDIEILLSQVVKMYDTLERFQSAKIQPFKDKIHSFHFALDVSPFSLFFIILFFSVLMDFCF